MIVDNTHVFDGRQLRERFAFKTFGYSRTLAIGNIISFCGALNYRTGDNVLAAEETVNFCLELPKYDSLSGVLFNRLFIANVGQILSTSYLGCPIQISQNQLVVEKEHTNNGVKQRNGIVSVNMCSQVGDAFMIYLGLYNKTGESAITRAFAMGLNAENSKKLMEEVNQSFYFLSNDIFLNTCHVI